MTSSISPQLDLAAVILAGGQSSRMGRDKALIRVRGVPLLQQTCQIALAISNKVYVVTPWLEKYRAILPPGCQVIVEQQPSSPSQRSPLIGLSQALDQIKTEWILVLACDLPYLEVGQLREWVNYIAHVDSKPIAALPRHPKGWEPLCGFYHINCRSSLQAYISQGGRDFQGWLATQPVEALPIDNWQMLFNCNTPQDLSQIKS